MAEDRKYKSSIIPGRGKKNTIDYGHKGIEEGEEEYYREFLAREVHMDDVFSRTVKIADELLSRAEREITRGMQYKAKQDPRMSNFDPKVSKSFEGLGKLVAQLQGIHLRLLKEGERAAKNMSREEKTKQCVNFLNKLPAPDKLLALRDMGCECE